MSSEGNLSGNLEIGSFSIMLHSQNIAVQRGHSTYIGVGKAVFMAGINSHATKNRREIKSVINAECFFTSLGQNNSESTTQKNAGVMQSIVIIVPTILVIVYDTSSVITVKTTRTIRDT